MAVGEVRPEPRQVVPARAEVVVDDVEADADARAGGRRRRTAAAPRDRRRGRATAYRRDAVVPPAPPARQRGDRHQLDDVDAERDEVVEAAGRRVEGALGGEGADVQLVERRRRPTPRRRAARASRCRSSVRRSRRSSGWARARRGAARGCAGRAGAARRRAGRRSRAGAGRSVDTATSHRAVGSSAWSSPRRPSGSMSTSTRLAFGAQTRISLSDMRSRQEGHRAGGRVCGPAAPLPSLSQRAAGQQVGPGAGGQLRGARRPTPSREPRRRVTTATTWSPASRRARRRRRGRCRFGRGGPWRSVR